MNKKAVGMTWIEMLEMLVLIAVIVVVGFGIKGVYKNYFKDSQIPEQPTNNFRMLAAQLDKLKVENGKKTFFVKIGKEYEITAYSKCPEDEEPSGFCSRKPKICLNYIKESKKKIPYCEDMENLDFKETTTLTASKYINMEKEKTDDGIIAKVYT